MGRVFILPSFFDTMFLSNMMILFFVAFTKKNKSSATTRKSIPNHFRTFTSVVCHFMNCYKNLWEFPTFVTQHGFFHIQKSHTFLDEASNHHRVAYPWWLHIRCTAGSAEARNTWPWAFRVRLWKGGEELHRLRNDFCSPANLFLGVCYFNPGFFHKTNYKW